MQVFTFNLCFPTWPHNCGNSDNEYSGTEDILQKSLSQSLNLPHIYCPTFLTPEPRGTFMNTLCLLNLITVPHAKGWPRASWLFTREPCPAGGAQATLSGAWSCGTKDASNLLFLCIFQAMLCIELQKAQLGCIVLQPALIKGLSCARNFFICPDIRPS